jgi:uncharacterized protein YjbJ (UPF0337 family)
MATGQQLSGNWGQLKGKVKEHWGQLTDDELKEVEGNYDQLVGLIQQKTGETREQVEHFLRDIAGHSEGRISNATESVRQYADQAGQMVRERAEQLRYQAEEHYEEATEMVRAHPREAIVLAFGTGVVLGILIGLNVGSRD